MSPSDGRRPRTLVFMAIAAYTTIAAVALSVVLNGAGHGLPAPLLVALVVLFGASVPIGSRPWSRTGRGLLATLVIELFLITALLFLAPRPWIPAVLFFIFIPVSGGVAPPLRYLFYGVAPLLTLLAALIEGYLVGEWGSAVSLLPGFVAIIVFTESFRAVRASSQESKKLLDELVSTQAQLRDAAVNDERRRLAQEMHDSVGHRLTVASVHLEAACRLIEREPGRAAEHAAVSREQVRAGLAELRAAVSSLSSPEGGARSLRRRIADTVGAVRAGGGVEVATDLDPAADELANDAATVILRSVQEGLTNVQKHAPGARVRVALAVLRDEGWVELVIEDTGSAAGVPAAGAAPADEGRAAGQAAAGGFGLRSLRERAAAVGGSVEFVRDGSGARLAVIVPMAGT